MVTITLAASRAIAATLLIQLGLADFLLMVMVTSGVTAVGE
jgi:hypothetical protein